MRIVRRDTGSVVTWRRAQMVLLSAQGMDAAAIAKVAFTSEDRVRDVIRNFNADGFDSLYPKYRGGRPPKFTLKQRREVKKIARSRPAEHDLPFSTWSLPKLAEFLVADCSAWSSTPQQDGWDAAGGFLARSGQPLGALLDAEQHLPLHDQAAGLHEKQVEESGSGCQGLRRDPVPADQPGRFPVRQ